MAPSFPKAAPDPASIEQPPIYPPFTHDPDLRRVLLSTPPFKGEPLTERETLVLEAERRTAAYRAQRRVTDRPGPF